MPAGARCRSRWAMPPLTPVRRLSCRAPSTSAPCRWVARSKCFSARVGRTWSACASRSRRGLASNRRLGQATRRPLLPAPGIGAHGLDAALRAPAQQRVGQRRIGVALRDVARAACDDAVRYLATAHFGEGTYHLENTVAATGAEVDREHPGAAFQRIERGRVAAREIDDMNVVTHPGSIGGGIVPAEDLQLGQLARGYLRDIRHEVVRN